MNDDIERGCLLPIVQSGVSFALLFGLAFGVARWQGWNNPGWMALTLAAAGALLTWVSGVLAWRRHVYGAEEPFYYPQPIATEPAQPVRVELSQDDGRRMSFIDLPASAEQLSALAGGLLTGASLSESTWTGGKGLFSRAEFSQLRAELIRRGLARWNNPHTTARGAALTPAGRAVMRQFSLMVDNPPHPPPPGAGDGYNAR